MSGHPRNPASSGAQAPRARLPTVQEALQFSPLTSIVPFSSDVLPFPEAIPTNHSSHLLNHEESALVDRTLSFLNSQTSNIGGPSSVLKETLRTLQQDLLVGNSLTRLNFKRPTLIQHIVHPVQAKDRQSSSFANKLQPFSKVLLDSTEIPYRYAPTAAPASKATMNGFHPKIQVSHQTTPKHNASSGQSGSIEVRVSSQSVTQTPLVTAETVSVQTPSTVPAVVIPSLPQAPGLSEYQKFPELDAAIIQETPSITRKRKHDVEDFKAQLADVSVSQAQADTAVLRLQEMLFNIFEAEDQLEPDTSSKVTRNHQDFFVQVPGTERPLLVASMHTQLEQALLAVLEVGRYGDIPIEDFTRLRKICMMPITLSSRLELTVPQDGKEDNLDDWTQKLEIAENSLRASRVLLRMMASEREEKQLYSEEALQELLGSLKHVLETCIVPIVEKRSSTSEGDLLKGKSDQVKLLIALLQRAGKVLKLLGDVLLKHELSEGAITTIEFLAIQLVFVENAPSEKESLLGIQRFETLRRHAMDLVAKVFLKYPEQRSFILDEILTSLEKLPVNRQNARHFKLIDGKPIQLVSALIMLLIQTSAVQHFHGKIQKERNVNSNLNDEDDDNDSVTSAASSAESDQPIGTFIKRDTTLNNATFDLDPVESISSLIKPLFDNAQNDSSYVGKYLVQRAMTSTKTGDQPYRNLLDIFTEDFISVLGSPDWPASELLLRALLSNLVGIADNEKSAAPPKNMALEIMGLMGSGIADLHNYISRSAQNLEISGTSFGRQVAQIYNENLNGGTLDSELLKIDGPCRAVIDYYQENKSDDLQAQSARGYFLMHWARNVWAANDVVMSGEESETSTKSAKIFAVAARWLQGAIEHPDEIASDKSLANLTAADIRLSYALVVLNMPFCKAFRRMISVFLTALASPHATVKSRSLKALAQLLEKDSSILDRFSSVLKHIMHCAADSSPLVRDSALALLGKCMSLRPSLEPDACKAIIARTMDAAVGVRKRAIKLLREVYLRNKGKDTRTAIADALLRRVSDMEESVAEMARQTMEETWFSPFQDISTHGLSVQMKQDLQKHAIHVVSTVNRDAEVQENFEKLLKIAFSEASKTSESNLSVSKHLVSMLFENIIDNESKTGHHSQQNILQTLTIFAKSSARLFTADQMVTLKPYIENLSTNDDLVIYRSVLIIYRFVLPVLPPLQQDFLRAVQTILFNSISKLRKWELLENAACLSIIDGVLKNTERLARLMVSVLDGIETAKKQNSISNPKDHGRIIKYMTIAGCFGSCNVDGFKDLFRQKFPSWKGDSVSDLIVDVICPLSRSQQPLTIREVALDSMCLTCQSAPKNFIRPQVTAAFTEAFQEQQPRLELIILSGIREFYETEEERSKSGSEIAIGSGVVKGAERLGNSMVLNDNDGATTSIAQHYLTHVLRIAVDSLDELAVTATEVIASTNRQGLVHPKETGPALVALETSPNTTIAQIALTEHRNLHAKHESMLEKEYLNAIEQAFNYHRNTVRDTSGVDAQKLPKLRSFYDVLKSGSAALRKKLLGNICSRLDHDLTRSKKGQYASYSLSFARFVIENLSLIEYARVDELLHLMGCIEKIFAKTGNELSQRIETSLSLSAAHPADSTSLVDAESGIGHERDGVPLDATVLKDLTACAMTLSMLWETRMYLRRLWGLQSLRDGKAKPAAKDVSKAPTKSGSVSSEKHLEKIAEIMDSLDTEEKMLHRCKAFMDLLAVDNELKVASDPEDIDGVRYRTPSEEAADGDVTPKAAGGSGAGGKRKSSMSAKSTPSKPRKRGKPSLTPRKRSRSHEEEDGEGDWE